MYSMKDLDAEISEACEELVTNGEIPKSWVVQFVMERHTDIHGSDAYMALCCMHETVKTRVNKHFTSIKASEDETPQLPLPGFKRLQRRYVITRNKEQSIVSIYEMSIEEIREKRDEHIRAGEGHFEHAEELDRFAKEIEKKAKEA